MGDFLDHFTVHQSIFNDFRDAGIMLPGKSPRKTFNLLF